MGGENLAIDLADTLVTVTDPATDLLTDQSVSDRFWDVHAAELPPGWAAPSLAKTRTLRTAIRTLLDCAHQSQPLDSGALATLNAAASLVPSFSELVILEDEPVAHERWQDCNAEDLTLTAAARSAISVLATPELRSTLRRCASAACSMLYVKGDARRRWCTPNICSNRDRAARHYRRQHQST